MHGHGFLFVDGVTDPHFRYALHLPMSGMLTPVPPFLKEVRNRGFCRQEKAGDGSRSLQDCANQLDRINDTHGDHVAALRRLGILTEIVGVIFLDPASLSGMSCNK